MISRRAFLRAGSAGALAASTPSWLAGRAVAHAPPDGPPGLPEGRLLNPRTLRPWKDALPVPPEVAATTLAAKGLTMASGMHRFHSDLPEAQTWGYGIGRTQASYLGPTVRARRGQPITFTATNDLGRHPLAIDPTLHGAVPGDAEAPRTSLHHHGGYTEPGSDGYPEDTFVPGEEHVYHYSNDQQAGPTWFHDHALGITRLNVYAGLAAAYLIEDEVTDGFSGVPATYGVDDFPLVLQDKAFDRRTGALHYPAEWVPEFFGNVPVVNGAILPTLSVGRGLVRLRLLNGSSSRFYRLRLSNPRVPVFQIATDTGYKPSTPLAAIELAPGERTEVVVDFTRAPGTVFLVDSQLQTAVSPSPGALGQLLRFEVSKDPMPLRGPFAPKGLPGVPALAQPTARRYLTLVEVMDPATGAPAASLLNNLFWEGAPEREQPTVNTVEDWYLVNLTADTHPIHLHLVQFHLLDRVPFDAAQYTLDSYGVPELMVGDDVVDTGPAGTGNLDPSAYVTGPPLPPPPAEVGWLDTVQAHPGMVTRIRVPFGPEVSQGVFGGAVTHTGRYVWHCHILDHEDNEMMLPYDVVA